MRHDPILTHLDLRRGIDRAYGQINNARTGGGFSGGRTITLYGLGQADELPAGALIGFTALGVFMLVGTGFLLLKAYRKSTGRKGALYGRRRRHHIPLRFAHPQR